MSKKNRISKVCKKCEITFEVQKYREFTALYCSRHCSNSSGVKRTEAFKKNLSDYNKSIGRRPPSNLGKHHSLETRIKIAKANSGPHFWARDEKNSNWKGDKIGYGGLHDWVRKWLGRPKKCSHCGFVSQSNRQFHWANISRKYKRILTDWIRLCVSCHQKYDYVRVLEKGLDGRIISNTILRTV